MNAKRLYAIYAQAVEDYGRDAIVSQMMKQALMEDEVATTKNNGIRMTDYVANTKDAIARPAMGCVYYNNGEIVATDAHALMVLCNQTYPANLEQALINKAGENLRDKDPDAKYVRYHAVFPKMERMEEFAPDWEAIAEGLKSAKVEIKAGRGNPPILLTEGVYMTAREAERLLHIHKVARGVCYKDKEGAGKLAVLMQGDNFKFLAMPCCPPERKEN